MRTHKTPQRRDPTPMQLRQHARRREYLEMTAATRCPYCETASSAMTGAPGTDYREARPGEWGICQGCAAPLIVTEDGGVRKPTDEEAEKLQGDEMVQKVRGLVALGHAWKTTEVAQD